MLPQKVQTNENLIAYANFRIWILNFRGGKMNRKSNTKCNSTKKNNTESHYVTLTHCDTKKKKKDWLCYMKENFQFKAH